MNIMIADDTKTERFFLNRLLLKLGIKADVANGGKAAIKLSAQKKYDIIFLDIAMPEPDGPKTCDRIRKNADGPNISTPVVYMGDKKPAELLEDSDSYYLEKPVVYNQLKDLIKSLVPEGSIVEASSAEQTNTTSIPKWLIDIPSLNTDDGVKHCGSEDGYLAALDIYYSTILAKADEIEEYFNNEDYESYTIKVHALKSSSRIIGANELADAALALETAGKENDIDTIKKDTAELLNNYREYSKLLAPISGADGSKDDSSDENQDEEPNVPSDVLADAYKSIGDFSDAMDFDLTEMVIKSLDEYILPKDDAKKVANIRTKLLNLDWDGIKEILGDIQ